MGTGLQLAGSVRFTVAAAEVCRGAFTVLGRRSLAADPGDRAGVGAASRHVGATLAVWASLAPDAVALVGFAAVQRRATVESVVFAELVAGLESGPLTGVATGFLRSLSAALAETIAVAGPADGRLVTGLRMVEVHLADARSGLRPGAKDPVIADDEVQRASTAVLGPLVRAMKDFSSPLTVPKSLATNHPTW